MLAECLWNQIVNKSTIWLGAMCPRSNDSNRSEEPHLIESLVHEMKSVSVSSSVWIEPIKDGLHKHFLTMTVAIADIYECDMKTLVKILKLKICSIKVFTTAIVVSLEINKWHYFWSSLCI